MNAQEKKENFQLPTSEEALLVKLKAELFRRQESDGCWRGRLSSSALSTAVGLFALARVDYDKYRDIVRGGAQWLADNINDDGGWGDTIRSKSNLSTTLLVWSVFNCSEEVKSDFSTTEQKAAVWLENRIGGLEYDQIISAVVGYYGKDKTFAVPILAMLTMAGRLGPVPKAWDKVSQLPFELSVLPQSFFRWLRLPVVSYALPALIAIGVVRHVMAPSKNLFGRVVRDMVLARAIKVLESVQPTNGGFLEATPLTGFVVMSLSTAGYGDCLVVESGAEFLVKSVHDDGSWAIDTDLATWVTTLAVNAVDIENDITVKKRVDIKDWLLKQQFKEKHPFTGAASGGWGWTDLPGSVPDADDTAGALLALKKLSATDDVEVKRAAEAGLGWLLGVQNYDGGIPTFCKGWGVLPFDMSCPDITAHAVSAISAWEECMDKKIRHRIDRAKARMLRYLEETQGQNGSWIPLWFGNEHAAKDANPVYGTARVLAGLRKMLAMNGMKSKKKNFAGERMIEAGYRFLCGVQNDDGGWGGDAGVASTVEETALSVMALSDFDIDDCNCAVERGVEWLIRELAEKGEIKATPIGLYFASLWYYEDMYPLVFAVSALQQRDC